MAKVVPIHDDTRRLAILAQAAGLFSTHELAAACGVSRAHMSRMLTGASPITARRDPELIRAVHMLSTRPQPKRAA